MENLRTPPYPESDHAIRPATVAGRCRDGSQSGPMIPRQHPIAPPAVLFASRGASGHSSENTLESFALARRLGASGIESDLRCAADGTPVLVREARVGGLRKRAVADLPRADLPAGTVDLDAFYAEVGSDLELLLHVHDPAAVEVAIATATRHRAVERLWLAGSDRDSLRRWRERSAVVRLVDTTPASEVASGIERFAAGLREDRVDAMLFPRSDWTGGRIALFHRFGRRCLATDAPHERMIRMLLHIGLDGVSSGYPDRLVDVAAELGRPDAPDFLDD